MSVEVFEHQDCPRCGGEGRIPTYSNVQGGVCFKCGGLKRILTAHGKRDVERYRAAVDAVVVKPVSELVAGQAVQLRDFKKYVPVTSVQIGPSEQGRYETRGTNEPLGPVIYDQVYIIRTQWEVTIDTHCMLGKYKTDRFEIPPDGTVRIHQGDAMPKREDFVTVSRAAKKQSKVAA